jgi:4,5-dihydroxyphthalate decarboxylase
MSLRLKLACGTYDRTRALLDGRVPVAGCTLDCESPSIEDMFSRAFGSAEFDVTELSFSNFMMRTAEGTCPYIGIPVFPSRTFRHSSIYIRTDRGIEKPQDLRGKRVGVREFSNTAALVARGMLEDVYGLCAGDMRWRVGDVDEKERDTIPVPDLGAACEIQAVTGRLLSDMLAEGELDALFAYTPPRCFEEGHAQVARLFPDYPAAERDFFARTRIFPIMHLVGIRRSIAEREPWVAAALFKAFSAAKAYAVADLAAMQSLKIMLPWVGEELKRTRALMGEDFWPYGIAANRATIDSLTRYSHAQGLSGRRLALDELFAPTMLDT